MPPLTILYTPGGFIFVFSYKEKSLPTEPYIEEIFTMLPPFGFLKVRQDFLTAQIIAGKLKMKLFN